MANQISEDKWHPDIKCIVKAAHKIAENDIGYGKDSGNYVCTSFANAVISAAQGYTGWTGVLKDGYATAMNAVSYSGGVGKYGKWRVYNYGEIDPWPGDLLGWHPGDNSADKTAGHVGWVIGYGGPVAEAVGSGEVPDYEIRTVYEKTSPGEKSCNNTLSNHTEKTIKVVVGGKSPYYQTERTSFWVGEEDHDVYVTKYYKKSTSGGSDTEISWSEYNEHKNDPNYYSQRVYQGTHTDLKDETIEYYLKGNDSNDLKAELGDQGDETIDTGSAGSGRNWKYIARNWYCWDGIDHFENRDGTNKRYQIPP